MKALSLWQPWATAIAVGSKGIETRGWATAYRGPLAIHAATRKVLEELHFLHSHWFWQGAMQRAGWSWNPGSEQDIHNLPFGAIVAVCDLIDCRPTGHFLVSELDTPRKVEGANGLYIWTERDMGDFAPGRFGWVLCNVRPLARPVPWKGAQGLFTVPDDVVAGALEAAE